MYLIFGCENDREVVPVAASVKAVGGLDWMTRPTQVNCCKHRQTWRAKDAVQAPTKMVRSQAVRLQYAGTRIQRLPV